MRRHWAQRAARPSIHRGGRETGRAGGRMVRPHCAADREALRLAIGSNLENPATFDQLWPMMIQFGPISDRVRPNLAGFDRICLVSTKSMPIPDGCRSNLTGLSTKCRPKVDKSWTNHGEVVPNSRPGSTAGVEGYLDRQDRCTTTVAGRPAVLGEYLRILFKDRSGLDETRCAGYCDNVLSSPAHCGNAEAGGPS